MGDWNTTLQSKFYVFLCCFNANKQEILCSQTLLGRFTLLTPDQLLRSSDCSALERTSRCPHQLCYLATMKEGERFKRESRKKQEFWENFEQNKGSARKKSNSFYKSIIEKTGVSHN